MTAAPGAWPGPLSADASGAGTLYGQLAVADAGYPVWWDAAAEFGASCNLGQLTPVEDRTPGMQIKAEPDEPRRPSSTPG